MPTETPEELLWFSGNYTEMQMTLAQADSVSHPGPCDDDVAQLLEDPAIAEQLAKIDPDSIRKELKEYGAWDEQELANDKDNQTRFIWCAGCDISEQAFAGEDLG